MCKFFMCGVCVFFPLQLRSNYTLAFFFFANFTICSDAVYISLYIQTSEVNV